MDKMFRRKWKITISSGNTSIDVSPLRCTFEIEKVAQSIANFAELTIYNPTPETATEISEGAKMTIEAGYYQLYTDSNGKTAYKVSSQYGVIFQGNIIQRIVTKENAIDFAITLISLDGESFLNGNWVSFSVAKGMTPKQIIQKICGNANVNIDVGRIADDLADSSLPCGKTYYGDPKIYLRQIAKANDTDFYIEDGKLYMDKSTYAPNVEDIQLSPSTGLLNVPQQVYGGVEFQCLLDPRIKLKTSVKIDNSIIKAMKIQRGVIPTMLDEDGRYLAFKINHRGDTRGNDWITEVTGITTNGMGALYYYGW